MGVVSDCYCYVVYQQQQETKVVSVQATGNTCSVLCMLQAMSVPCAKTTLEETHTKKYLLLEKQTTLISCHVPRVT